MCKCSKLFIFQDLNSYSSNFAISCRVLHALSEGMPDALFGKTLREVYVNSLAGGESEDWNQFTRLISLSSAHELKTRIEAALVTLKEAGASNAVSNHSASLLLFTEELKRLEEAPDVDIVCSPKSQSVFVPQGKKLDKFELKAVSSSSKLPVLTNKFRF